MGVWKGRFHMKIWKKAMACLLCSLVISGCGAAPDGTAGAENSVPVQSGGSESAQPGQGATSRPEIAALVHSEAFGQADRVFLSIYKDEESGVELQYSADTEGEYRIVCGEQETFWELDAVPEDIREIQIQSWGGDDTFLILTAGLKDRTESTFILNKEMMSQVFMQDPYALAESNLDYTVMEEENIFLLGEEGFYIECEDSEALTVLEKFLRVADEISYGVEEGSFVCSFPVCIGPDDIIGTMNLYYEYDGVGMNCIGTRFIPV